jgi:hypothetical protein
MRCSSGSTDRIRLHPLIGAGCLLAGAFLLPGLGAGTLFVLSLVLIAIALAGGAGARLLRGVRQIRWLLAALMLVYLAFTPGEPLSAALPGFSREGLAGGTRRALMLVDIVAGVAILLEHTPVPLLASGLLTGLRPLSAIGLDVSRAAVRLALTLEEVDGLSARLRSAAAAKTPLAACAELLLSIEHRASQPAPVTELKPLPAPPLWQWPLPFLLAGALWAAGA